jgi:hypothetical protein
VLAQPLEQLIAYLRGYLLNSSVLLIGSILIRCPSAAYGLLLLLQSLLMVMRGSNAAAACGSLRETRHKFQSTSDAHTLTTCKLKYR